MATITLRRVWTKLDKKVRIKGLLEMKLSRSSQTQSWQQIDWDKYQQPNIQLSLLQLSLRVYNACLQWAQKGSNLRPLHYISHSLQVFAWRGFLIYQENVTNVGLGGIEPPTFTLSVWRSTTEPQTLGTLCHILADISVTPSQTRQSRWTRRSLVLRSLMRRRKPVPPNNNLASLAHFLMSGSYRPKI